MKLSHVAIGCADIEKVAAFYIDILGFKEAFRMTRDDRTLNIIYLDAGSGTFIELLNRGGEVGEAVTVGLSHICLAVEDMEAELERLAALEVEPGHHPKRASDGNDSSQQQKLSEEHWRSPVLVAGLWVVNGGGYWPSRRRRNETSWSACRRISLSLSGLARIRPAMKPATWAE